MSNTDFVMVFELIANLNSDKKLTSKDRILKPCLPLLAQEFSRRNVENNFLNIRLYKAYLELQLSG